MPPPSPEQASLQQSILMSVVEVSVPQWLDHFLITVVEPVSGDRSQRYVVVLSEVRNEDTLSTLWSKDPEYLTADMVQYVVYRVVRALQALHNQGISYGSVGLDSIGVTNRYHTATDGTILMNAYPDVMLTDFSKAARVQEGVLEAPRDSPDSFDQSVLPALETPERIRGSPFTHRDAGDLAVLVEALLPSTAAVAGQVLTNEQIYRRDFVNKLRACVPMWVAAESPWLAVLVQADLDEDTPRSPRNHRGMSGTADSPFGRSSFGSSVGARSYREKTRSFLDPEDP
jgi:serine/threonine protein kinase